MFIEDDSLQYVEADTQDVLAVYRSVSTVAIAHGDEQQQSCEAFICVVQDGTDTSLYVALSLLRSKRFVIFVPENQPSDKLEYESRLNEAMAFLKEKGFSMQNVNLNYSKALREVVLSDLRVVQRISGGKRISHKKGHVDKSGRGPAQAPGKPSRDDGVKGSETAPAAVGAAPEKTGKKGLHSQGKKEGEPESEDRVAPGSNSAGADEAHAAKLEGLKRETGLVSEEIRSLLETREAELASARSELERLTAEKATAQQRGVEELSSLRAEIEAAAREMAKAAELSARDVEEAKTQLDRLTSEKTSVEEAGEAELKRLREEIEHLSQLKESSERTLADESALLKSELAKLQEQTEPNAELEFLRARVEELRRQMESSEKEKSAELESFRAEIARQEAEKNNREAELGKELEYLRDELARVEREKTDAARALSEQGDALKAEIERLSSEKVTVEQLAEQERSMLQEQIRGLEEEIAHSSETTVSLLGELRLEAERLTAEKSALQERSDAEIAALKSEYDRRRMEVESARNDADNEMRDLKAAIERLAMDKNAMEDQAASELNALQEELDRVKGEKEAAEAKSRDELDTARALVSKLTSDLEEIEKGLTEQINALTGEAARLLKEKEAAELEADEAVAEAQHKVSAICAELSNLENTFFDRMMAVRLSLATPSPERDRSAQIPMSLDEGQRMIAPVVTEEAVASELQSLRAHIAQLSEEKAAAMEAATAEMATLRAEIERLSLGEPTEEIVPLAETIESPEDGVMPAEAEATLEVAPDAIETVDELQEQEVVQGEVKDEDPFAFLKQDAGEAGIRPVFAVGPSGAPVQFSMVREVKTIEYAAPEEVLAVYQSLNRTRVSMEDRTMVTCDAYLCGLKRNGIPRVYIALHMVDDNGVLVYSPDKQPETDEEFARIMQGGMDFIEIVGFMMDGVDLGDDADMKAKALCRIPVLQQVC